MPYNFLRSVLFFFLALCPYTAVSALYSLPEYTIRHLSQDDGLSQGSNYFRYEDNAGFMWIAANDAINRYDGSRVKVYNLSRYFKNCPPLQEAYGFAGDKSNNIYIGSISGLYIYHRNTDRFTLSKVFTGKDDNLVMSFGFKDSCVWCFNKEYKVAAYNVYTGITRIVAQIPLAALPSVHKYDLADPNFYDRWPFIDHNNTAWFMSRNHVFTLDIKSAAVHEIKLSGCQTFFCSFYDSLTQQVLIGTERGLLSYDIDTHSQQLTTHIGNQQLAAVTAVCCNNQVLFMCSGEDLVIAGKQNNMMDGAIRKLHKSNGIYDFGTDKTGSIWFCEDGFGQTIYDFTPLLIPRLPSDGNNTTFHHSYKGVSQFAELANGDIVIHRNGILTHQSGVLRPLRFPENLKQPIFFVTETDPFRKGVWFLFDEQEHMNLSFWSKDNHIKQVYKARIDDTQGSCQDLKILPDGRLLFAFTSGLYWFSGTQFEKVPHQLYRHPFVINLLSGNRCAVSYLNNDMWLIQPDNKKGIIFRQRILPGVQSFYLLEDSGRHAYWVGTNKGIYLLDSGFRTLKVFDANNGLAGTFIYGLLLDNNGNAWCSHQHGLSSIDARNFRIINYDKSDGIQDWDYNNRSCYKASDGTLYFGGVNGFNFFKPPLLPHNSYHPEVYVDEILVNNTIWRPDTSANLIQRLSLTHRQNNISIRAAIKDLAQGHVRRIIYRICETDTAWKQLPANSMFSFNNLAPGSYTLQLGVSDKFSTLPVCQKTISLIIATPYYQKRWFIVLITILCSLFLFLLYLQIRHNRHKAQLRQQHALEQERHKIIADLHDDIGASLSSLQVNSVVAQQLLHQQPERAYQVLEKIAAQSKTLSGKISDMIWSMKPGKDEFMALSSRIKNFAHDILGDTNIHYLINVDKKADTEITDMSIRRNVVLIIKEAINNVVKYSAASMLDVNITIKSQCLQLSITDNGSGFDIHDTTSGNGLANMKKRAHDINGNFTIVSVIGKGTTITVDIPLKT